MRLLLADDGVGRAVLRRKLVFFAWWNCGSLPYGENSPFLRYGAGGCALWRFAGSMSSAMMGMNPFWLGFVW